MSVPAYKRQKPDPNNPRDPEFVLLSKKLYVEVIDLLSCMSARYGRLIAVPTAELAGEVQDFAVKANDVFPSDGQKLALRREYLLRCHAAAALPLLQDEVPADGNGPGGDAPHRGRTEALPAENTPAGCQGRLGGRKGADRERQGLLQETQRQRTLDSAADAAQRTAKGEGSMRYVCHRRARFESISGRVNIPYGAALERQGDFLYYQGRQLCAAGSQRAHEHFKRDDDGQGLRRGALTEAICKTLERRDAGHQDRWDRVWADKLCGKYRHPDHEDHFLWGNAFFEAPIADLNYIAALVGAGKER